eukprot:Skav220783  [mRNA]  locus=scaffold3169:214094:218135:+ [translate_table: standard]
MMPHACAVKCQDLGRQLAEEQGLVLQLRQELREAEALNSTLRSKSDDAELRECMAQATQWAGVPGKDFS